MLKEAATCTLLCLALIVAPVLAQPEMVATMMAGQVANIMANTVEKKIEEHLAGGGGSLETCMGPECCMQSTCMNVPGMHCAGYRGLTTCVGASIAPVAEGKCRCVKGACSADGICLETIGPDAMRSSTGGQTPYAAAPYGTQQYGTLQNGAGSYGAVPSAVVPISDAQGSLQTSGGDSQTLGISLPPVAIVAIMLVVANFVVCGGIWLVRKSRGSGYGTLTSEDEETPQVAGRGQPHRFTGH